MRQIILYSTGCPKCKVLKEKLDSAKINYIEENDTRKMLQLEIQSVPMLRNGDKLMDFTESVKWIGANENK